MSTLVIFDCPSQHKVEFSSHPPRRGELIWDIRCGKYQRVLSSAPEYRIRCRTCRYARKFGQARVTAEMKAAGHRGKHPSHTIELLNGYEVVYLFAPSNAQQDLF